MYTQPDAARVTLANHEVALLEEGGLQVVSALTDNPSTIRQLALRFNLSRARVKFIVDQLMQRGLVYIHRQVQEDGRIEVYYAAAAKDVMLTLNADSSQDARLAGIEIILNSLRTNVLKAITNPFSQTTTTLKLAQCRMSGTTARAFAAQIEELASEFGEAEEKTAAEEFVLVLALYPVLDHSR